MSEKDDELRLREIARLAGFVGAFDEDAELPEPLLLAVTTMPRRQVEQMTGVPHLTADSVTRDKDGPALFI
jgi:hypothetical protein